MKKKEFATDHKHISKISKHGIQEVVTMLSYHWLRLDLR